MKNLCCAVLATLLVLVCDRGVAQNGAMRPEVQFAAAAAGSADLPAERPGIVADAPEIPGNAAGMESGAAGTRSGGAIGFRRVTSPFSALAIGVNIGFAGVGVEVATPLAQKLNLRGGASFFSYNPDLVENGIDIQGDIRLRSAMLSLDLFPCNGSFRISPGLTVYNGNRVHAVALVPGGQEFDPGDGTYTSDPADPVHGTFDIAFGRTVAPRLTLGFGNMIPRGGGHWSVPFELGAEYIGRKPVATLNLAGSVCQAGMGCGSIASYPDAQQNITQEQSDINGDIPTQLRFFPILSLGVSYRFGHVRATER